MRDPHCHDGAKPAAATTTDHQHLPAAFKIDLIAQLLHHYYSAPEE